MKNQRLIRLRKALKKAKIRALLVSSLLNIEYLTGIKASVAQLIVTPTSCCLFLDERYTEMAHALTDTSISIMHPKDLSSVLKKFVSFAIEGDSMSADDHAKLLGTYKKAKVVLTSGLILDLRRIKDAEELRLIKRACSITRRVLSLVPTFLQRGISEKQLAWILETECRKRGADCMAFETIVGFGTHTSRPHHRPTTRRLQAGDLVQIDMGALYKSYCSDFSRVYCFGTMTPEQKKAYVALSKAKKLAESLLKKGVSTHRLDKTVRSQLARSGYPDGYPHALGHGVGMEIHEGVVLSEKRPDEKLQKGDVITIEPGLYFDGAFGMRLEDTHCIA